MFRKALIAATAAGALALGIGAFATAADAYVRFGVYVGPGPGYYGGYCGPWWHRHPCYGAYYGGPYYHHHYYYPYYHHYYYHNY